MRALATLPALLVTLLVVLLGVGRAGAEEAAAPSGVRELFERVRAFFGDGAGQMSELYDGMAAARRAHRALGGTGQPSTRSLLAVSIVLGLEIHQQRRDQVMPAFTSVRLLSWKPDAAGTSGIVVALLEGSDDFWILRAWLVQRSEDKLWRLADSEFLDAGLRDSMLVLQRGGDATWPGARAFQRAFTLLTKAETDLDEERYDEAVAQLRRTSEPPLGPVLEGYRQRLLARGELEREQPAQALEAARASLAADPECAWCHWLLARAHEALEQPVEALVALETYLSEVGDEPLGLHLLVRLHEEAGRREEALAASRRGFGVAPRWGNFAGPTLRLLPEGRKAEALPILLAAGDLGDAADEAASVWSAEDADVETLAVLTEAFAHRAPAHAFGRTYAAALRLARGEREGALEVLRDALAGTLEEQAREPLRALLVRLPWHAEETPPERLLADVLASFDAASPVDRAWVFSGLAYELARGRKPEELERLMRRAHEVGGVGPDLAYYDAELAWLRGDMPGLLTALEALVIPEPLPEGAHEALVTVLGYWPMELKVRALVRLDRAAEALPVARMRYVTRDDARLLLIVHARLGHAEAAMRAFEACVAQEIEAQLLFEDEDTHEALLGEAYKALRAKHGLGE